MAGTVNPIDNPLAALLGRLPPAQDQLGAYLLEHARTRASTEAAVDETRRLTYAALAREVAHWAALLEAEGVSRGERVAVLAPPCIDFLVSFLATTALGGIWLGLNPKHTRKELEFVLNDAAPRVVLARTRIAGRDFLADLRALVPPHDARRRLALLDTRADAPDLASVATLMERHAAPRDGCVPQRARGADPALMVYTSGTTGVPKGALLSHRALIRGALVRANVWPVDPWRALNNLPINHIGCVGDIVCTTLVAGGCHVFMERFDAAATLQLLAREQVSFWYQIPTMFQLCLDQPRAAHMDWSHLDTAVWSGGRASQALIERLGRVARRLAVDYSMTESVGSISLTPGTRDRALLEDSIGWPDPGRGIRLADPVDGQALAPGTAGEVQLKDDWRFSGYSTPGPAGTSYTSDGWFRTGDLAVQRPDGTLQLVGRLKEMFKSGGYNVYPKEIEQRIEAHPEVAAAAVVPLPDPLYGEVGVAFVVSRGQAPSPADLDAHCRDTLANYKIPKHFLFLDRLPMLAIGKIDRLALCERARRDLR